MKSKSIKTDNREKDSNFDFWSEKKMDYDGRNRFVGGDNYGIGEAPKTGSMRGSYVNSVEAVTDSLKVPPKKVG